MLRFEPLALHHDVSRFSSRATYIDGYLKKSALREMERDRARTFVCLETEADGSEAVVGFFTLKTVIGQYVPALRDDIPEEYLYPVELEYLARDFSRYGQGIGETLLIEAFRYVLRASEFIGFPGLILTATRDGATLYERYGFLRIAPDRNEFYLPLTDIRAAVAIAEL